MFRKILLAVLCVVIAVSALAGCNLVTDNNEKNSLQVIARIDAIEDSGNDRHVRETTEDGEVFYLYTLSAVYLARLDANSAYDEASIFGVKKDSDDIYLRAENAATFTDVYDLDMDDLVKKTEGWSFSREAKDIYKYQLYSYVNNYAQQYMQDGNTSLETVVNDFVNQLVARELILAEAEKAIAKGEITLDNAYHNAVAKSIYSAIDTQYNTILNTLLKEQGLDELTEEEETNSTEPTYPIFEADDTTEDGEEPLWDISDPKYSARWPGMVGSATTKSHELTAVKRLVAALEETIKEDFRMTKAEREAAEADFERLYNVMNTQGVQNVYPMLGETFFIEYLVGKAAAEDQKISLLQTFIAGEPTASDEEILAEYNRTLAIQKESYDESIQNYYNASGEKLVLYNPEPDRFIYVKHILVQFSEEQKAVLNNYKDTPGATVDGYKALRDKLSKEIVGYEREDGEDLTDKPIPLATIENTIRSQMNAASASLKTADATFERLIYQFNMDPGGFDNGLGYAVINELKDEDTDSWVEEFSEGARKLRNETNNDGSRKYKVGDMLDYAVVTDHGVHFMYYSYQRPSGIVSLHDFADAGQRNTYYDLLAESVKAVKSNDAFEQWQNSTIYYYRDIAKIVKIHTNRFKDIYK